MIRRTLHMDDGTTLTDRDLPVQGVGRTVRELAASPDPYYLPRPRPAMDANPLMVLRKAIYLLGEDHGDGTWATRTAPWPHIPILLEREKSFTGQDPTEREGVRRAVGGRPEALEDMTAYLVAQATLLQNWLGDKNFELLWRDQDSLEEVRSTYRQVNAALVDHVEVAFAWTNHLKEPEKQLEEDTDAARRHADVVELAMIFRDPVWIRNLKGFAQRQEDQPALGELPDLVLGNLPDLVVGESTVKADSTTSARPETKVTGQASSTSDQEHLPFGLPGRTDRAALQKLVHRMIALALAFLDTRPTASMILFSYRKGDDPIPNRSQIEGLAEAGSGRAVDAIPATSPLREAKMAERILAKGAPVLVQVGNRHVEPLVKRLTAAGRDVVAVPKGTDFNALVTMTNRLG